LLERAPAKPSQSARREAWLALLFQGRVEFGIDFGEVATEGLTGCGRAVEEDAVLALDGA
jgi:hypothetical protein